MGKKKNAQLALAAADAESSGSSADGEQEDITFLKTRNAMLIKQVKQRREKIEHLKRRIATANLELVVSAGKKNAVKRELNHLRPPKKNAGVAGVSEAAECSEGNEIENLKVLNEQLVRQVAERREQIGRLRLELDTLAADHDVMAGIMHDVFGLVLSSTLSEAAAHKNAEMAALRKKTQSASTKLNAKETRLLEFAGEKDAIQRDVERIEEESNSTLLSLSLEQAKNQPRTWKKWIYPVAAASFSVAATAIVVLYKGCSNVKN